MHVFGDPAAYPPAKVRAYNPLPASLETYRKTVPGFTRVVIVQPSAYGTDNRCTIDALSSAPKTTRAIAVIDDVTPDATLAEWATKGVRGIRLNLVSNATPAPEKAAAELRRAAERCAPLGWHVQIFAMPTLIEALAQDIANLPVPVVIDHMGTTDGTLTPPKAMLTLLKSGKIWVKLSGANRVSAEGGTFRDALPVMRSLIETNPAQCLWGTDWPHIGPHIPGEPHDVIYMNHNHTNLLSLLEAACPDEPTFQTILATNPARLYGFG
jgi:predicted TIM-barrel fold metal-dependent hydrolase